MKKKKNYWILLKRVNGNKKSNLSDRKEELKNYARATIKKDKRVNIRISERDLKELQRIALREGLPYQTLISSILHKYVTGIPVFSKI